MVQAPGYFWYETRAQDSQLLNCVIFKEIKTINTALWLFNVSWQITVASVQTREPIVFSYLLKAWDEHE